MKSKINSLMVLSIFFLLILMLGCTQENPKTTSENQQPSEINSINENEEKNASDLPVKNEVLEIFILNTDGSPLNNIEVDLWKKETITGPPDVGFEITDSQGKSVFSVPKGEYRIGFNLNNFPKNMEYPETEYIVVKENEINSKTIKLKLKEELLERKLVALGSSITKANNLSSEKVGDYEEFSFSTGIKINSVLVYLKNRGENINPVNLAESGANSNDILNTQASNVEGYSPKYITLMVGGTDILEEFSVQAFKSNLQAIINKINTTEDSIILIGTIINFPKIRTGKFKSCKEDVLHLNIENLTEEKILEFNEAIKELAEENNLILVDLFDSLDSEHISDYDCIHPNISGQEKIAEEFIKALEKIKN
jgi:lysophospholipase L1-like esterase